MTLIIADTITVIYNRFTGVEHDRIADHVDAMHEVERLNALSDYDEWATRREEC